jgi:hypothetical protein
MLIRVVLAVNDFILPARFSEKSIKGGCTVRFAGNRFVGQSGFRGMLRSILGLARIPSGLKPFAPGQVLAFALAFSPVFL